MVIPGFLKSVAAGTVVGSLAGTIIVPAVFHVIVPSKPALVSPECAAFTRAEDEARLARQRAQDALHGMGSGRQGPHTNPFSLADQPAPVPAVRPPPEIGGKN